MKDWLAQGRMVLEWPAGNIFLIWTEMILSRQQRCILGAVRIHHYGEVFGRLVDRNVVIRWDAILLRQGIAIQDRADDGMVFG